MTQPSVTALTQRNIRLFTNSAADFNLLFASCPGNYTLSFTIELSGYNCVRGSEGIVKYFFLAVVLLILPVAFSSTSSASFGSNSYFSRNSGAYWKTNEFNYSYTPSSSSFGVSSDIHKSWDTNKSSSYSNDKKKMMDSPPHKWGPSEWPPKVLGK